MMSSRLLEPVLWQISLRVRGNVTFSTQKMFYSLLDDSISWNKFKRNSNASLKQDWTTLLQYCLRVEKKKELSVSIRTDVDTVDDKNDEIPSTGASFIADIAPGPSEWDDKILRRRLYRLLDNSTSRNKIPWNNWIDASDGVANKRYWFQLGHIAGDKELGDGFTRMDIKIKDVACLFQVWALYNKLLKQHRED